MGDPRAEKLNRLILKTYSAGLERRVFFLDDEADIPRIAPVRRELFGDHRPASTAVEISRLLLPGAKLEINAVALR